MAETTIGDDTNHPFLIQGRRHAREVIATAERIGRLAGDVSRPAILSTALQLTLSAALVDGEDPQDAYQSLVHALVWSLSRLPETDRLGVLTAMVTETIQKLEAFTEKPIVHEAMN